MFASVATLSDSMEHAQKKLANADDIKHHRVVLNLRRRTLEPVYTAWRDLVHRSKALRFKVMKRALHRGTTRGWLQWLAVVEERRQLQRLMRRALNADVTRAWCLWRESREQAHEQERLKAVCSRLASPALARCLNMWVSYADESRRRRQLARRAAGRILNRDLAEAWWLYAAAPQPLPRCQAALPQPLPRCHSPCRAAPQSVTWHDLT